MRKLSPNIELASPDRLQKFTQLKLFRLFLSAHLQEFCMMKKEIHKAPRNIKII